MANKQFTNLGQVNQFIQTQAGTASVLASGSLKKQLEEAGDLVRRLLQKHIQGYYDSYEPEVYERTYALLNSVRVEPVQQVGNQFSIRIYIDPETATHPSVMGGEPGYTATLISQGFSWKNDPNPVYRFTNFEGYDFIERTISDFNKENKWGFQIQKNVH